jgi:chromosome segregation ATPase
MGFLSKWLGIGKDEKTSPPPSEDPAVRLQRAVDEQAEKVRKAHAAVEKQAAIVRSLERERAVIQENIDILEIRASKPDSPVRDIEARLQTERKNMADKLRQVQEAKAELERGRQVLTDFDKAVDGLRQEASCLNVQVDLADAEKAAAGFQLDLNKGMGVGGVTDAREEIKRKIQRSRVEAEVDRTLGRDPNAARDAEYLKE